MKHLFTLLMVLSSFSLSGQSYIQDFTGTAVPAEWNSDGSSSFDNTLVETNGISEMKMHVDKTSKWSSFNMYFPEEMDFSQHPYIRMKLRSSVDYHGFYFFFYDYTNQSPGYFWSDTYSISADGTEIYWDFSDKASGDIDMTRIKRISIRPNSSVDVWTADLFFDFFYVGEAAAPQTDKEITGFSIPGVSVNTNINHENNSILVDLAGVYDITSLSPVIEISGESVSPSSGVARDFTGPVEYTVTAEDGTTRAYTVTTRAVDQKEILSFGLESMEAVAARFDVINHEISLQIKKGIDRSDLTAFFQLSSGAVAYSGINELESGVSSLDFTTGSSIITVEAIDASTTDWTIRVTERAEGNIGLQGVQLGLGGISYYGAERFANYLYMASRNWRDDATGETLLPSSGQLDANGYPLYLDAGQILMAHPGQNSHSPDDLLQGKISLTWEGTADIRAGLGQQISGTSDGMIQDGKREYHISGDVNGIPVYIHAIDPADPPTKIRLWLPHPDDPQNRTFEPAPGAKEPLFHPTYLNLINIEEFSTYRFMDWGHTNANPTIDWADRRPGDHAFMAGITVERASPGLEYFDGYDLTNYSSQGVAFEKMIELCNITGRNMWICVPHAATDDFIRNLAMMLNGDDPDGTGCPGLDEDVGLYVEYSNEIWAPWSTSFPQGTYALRKGEELFGEGVSDVRNMYIGHRSAEMWSIFNEELGDDRFEAVLGMWTGGGETRARITIESAVSRGAEIFPPSTPEALAVTTYFGNNIQEYVFENFLELWPDYVWDETNDIYSTWEDVPPAALNIVFDEWTNRMLSGEASTTGQDFTGGGGGFGNLFTGLSEEYDVPLVAYEGGTGLPYANFKYFKDCKMVDSSVEGAERREIAWAAGDCFGGGGDGGPYGQFIKAIHKDPRLTEVYYYNNTLGKAKGMTMATQFGDIGSITKYGWWAFLEHLTQDLSEAPKYNFTIDWSTENVDINNPVFPEGKAPKFLTNGELPPAREGVPYEQYIYYSNGDGNHIFDNLGGLMPGGINYQLESTENRIKIDGIPQQEGIYRFILRMMDTNGNNTHDPAYMVVTLRVLPAPLDEVFVYDDFTTASTYLHDTESGYGFSEPWDVQNNKTDVFNLYTDTPLQYPGLLSSGGKYAKGGGSYLTSGRKIDVSQLNYLASSVSPDFIGQTNTSTWLSFLTRRDAGASKRMILYLLDGQYPQSNDDQIVKMGVLDNGNWGLQIRDKANGGFIEEDTGVAVQEGTNELIVLEIKYGNDRDELNLYINPLSLGGGAPETPDLTYRTTTPGYCLFNRLGFYGSQNTDQVAIDDIRIGDSYKAVTPPDGSANVPPVAFYVASSTSGTTPFEVTFDASGSYDSDGTIASYKWDFGDGTVETIATATTSHIYNTEGTYPVKLTVSDNLSATGSYSDANINVSAPNVSPTATFSSSVTSGKRPLTVEFDGSTSNDPDGDITLYEWSFGDGTPSLYGQTVSHTFTEVGDFLVTLTVYDNVADKGTTSQTIQVGPNEEPIAAYTYEVGALYEVTFSAVSSSDPDGTIATYDWDFNDGTSGTGEVIAHTFAPGRKYRVTLLVTDNDGAINALSLDIDPEHPNYSWRGISPDWFDTSNWLSSIIPTADTDVFIPGHPPGGHHPLINGDASGKNITIEEGATISLEAGGTFNISASFVNYGEVILNSTPDNVSALNVPESNTDSGDGRIVLPVKLNQWYRLGQPFKFPTGAMYSADEPGNWVYRSTQQWERITDNANPINPMEGIMVLYENDHTIDYSGTFNTGPVSRTLPYGRGYYLFANPYPSSIRWTIDDVTDTGVSISDNISSTIYYRVYAGTQVGDYMITYNGEENVSTILEGGSFPEGYTTENIGNIAPLQSVWVKVEDANNATIDLTNKARISDNSMPLKSRSASERDLIRIIQTNEYISDVAVIYFDESFSDEIEGADSEKMFNKSSQIPEIYTRTEGKPLSINGLPSLDKESFQLPLSVRVLQEEEVAIRLDLNDFSSEYDVFLEDLNEEKLTNMSEMAEYIYTPDSSGDLHDRFILHFEAQKVTTDINADNEKDAKGITITAFKEHVLVIISPDLLTEEDAIVELMDINGRRLSKIETRESEVKLLLPKNNNVFIVTVKTTRVTANRKVLRP